MDLTDRKDMTVVDQRLIDILREKERYSPGELTERARAYPPLGRIRFLTVHCTATPEGLDCTGEQIERMDIARKDLQRPGYHLIVLLDGTLYRSYTDTTKGAHVGGHNTGNIGVSYVGGIDRVTKKAKDTRTHPQRETLREVVEYYRSLYPGIAVKGHRDWSPDLDKDGKIEPHEWIKMCPCFDVSTQL